MSVKPRAYAVLRGGAGRVKLKAAGPAPTARAAPAPSRGSACRCPVETAGMGEHACGPRAFPRGARVVALPERRQARAIARGETAPATVSECRVRGSL